MMNNNNNNNTFSGGPPGGTHQAGYGQRGRPDQGVGDMLAFNMVVQHLLAKPDNANQPCLFCEIKYECKYNHCFEQCHVLSNNGALQPKFFEVCSIIRRTRKALKGRMVQAQANNGYGHSQPSYNQRGGFGPVQGQDGYYNPSFHGQQGNFGPFNGYGHSQPSYNQRGGFGGHYQGQGQDGNYNPSFQEHRQQIYAPNNDGAQRLAPTSQESLSSDARSRPSEPPAQDAATDVAPFPQSESAPLSEESLSSDPSSRPSEPPAQDAATDVAPFPQSESAPLSEESLISDPSARPSEPPAQDAASDEARKKKERERKRRYRLRKKKEAEEAKKEAEEAEEARKKKERERKKRYRLRKKERKKEAQDAADEAQRIDLLKAIVEETTKAQQENLEKQKTNLEFYAERLLQNSARKKGILDESSSELKKIAAKEEQAAAKAERVAAKRESDLLGVVDVDDQIIQETQASTQEILEEGLAVARQRARMQLELATAIPRADLTTPLRPTNRALFLEDVDEEEEDVDEEEEDGDEEEEDGDDEEEDGDEEEEDGDEEEEDGDEEEEDGDEDNNGPQANEILASDLANDMAYRQLALKIAVFKHFRTMVGGRPFTPDTIRRIGDGPFRDQARMANEFYKTLSDEIRESLVQTADFVIEELGSEMEELMRGLQVADLGALPAIPSFRNMGDMKLVDEWASWFLDLRISFDNDMRHFVWFSIAAIKFYVTMDDDLSLFDDM